MKSLVHEYRCIEYKLGSSHLTSENKLFCLKKPKVLRKKIFLEISYALLYFTQYTDTYECITLSCKNYGYFDEFSKKQKQFSKSYFNNNFHS